MLNSKSDLIEYLVLNSNDYYFKEEYNKRTVEYSIKILRRLKLKIIMK